MGLVQCRSFFNCVDKALEALTIYLDETDKCRVMYGKIVGDLSAKIKDGVQKFSASSRNLHTGLFFHAEDSQTIRFSKFF